MIFAMASVFDELEQQGVIGALVETSARKLKNEAKREVAVSLLKMGKLTVEEIAECSELSITEVEQLAKLHTV